MTQNYALGIQYVGTRYAGWQRQSHADSVQGRLEAALTQIADHPVETICAGRTDAGVHALGQVVHFQTSVQRPDKAWVHGVNAALPHDVRVNWVHAVPTEFSARFSAESRRYQYLLYRGAVASPFLQGAVTHYPYPLDPVAIQAAAQHLLGEQDFSALRSAHCQSHTAMREVHFANVFTRADFLILDICANAFLHHMVRNIMGTLLWVGQQKCTVADFQQILQSKDRRLAGPTAPPDGLYLVAVQYPVAYDLPQFSASGIEALFYELD